MGYPALQHINQSGSTPTSLTIVSLGSDELTESLRRDRAGVVHSRYGVPVASRTWKNARVWNLVINGGSKAYVESLREFFEAGSFYLYPDEDIASVKYTVYWINQDFKPVYIAPDMYRMSATLKETTIGAGVPVFIGQGGDQTVNGNLTVNGNATVTGLLDATLIASGGTDFQDLFIPYSGDVQPLTLHLEDMPIIQSSDKILIEKASLGGSGTIGALHVGALRDIPIPDATQAALDALTLPVDVTQYASTASVPAGVGAGFSIPLTLNTTVGATADVNWMYEISLATVGTGTKTGAKYIVAYDIALTGESGSGWTCHPVSLAGDSSNHPLLFFSGGDSTVQLYNNHASSYGVKYFVDAIYSNDSDATPHMFGAHYGWERNANTLTAPEDVKASGNIYINESSGAGLSYLYFKDIGFGPAYLAYDMDEGMFNVGGDGISGIESIDVFTATTGAFDTATIFKAGGSVFVNNLEAISDYSSVFFHNGISSSGAFLKFTTGTTHFELSDDLDVDGSISATTYSGIQMAKGMTILEPETGDDLTLWFTDRAINVDQVNTVVRGSSPVVPWTVKFASDRTAAGTTMATTSASSQSGQEYTTMSNAAIPASNWVWLEIGTPTGTVDEYHITLLYTEE